MKESSLTLISRESLSDSGNIRMLRFDAPGIEARPGQFVNILVEGQYLRRPISVSDYDGRVLSLVIQIVGEGTRKLVSTPEGASLNMLTGLGNGFTLPEPPEAGTLDVLLIGGGVGYAPLVGLLRRLSSTPGVRPLAVFGFNSAADAPLAHIRALRAEGLPVETALMKKGPDADGSLHEGNVLEVALRLAALRRLDPVQYFSCGPMPMMKAVAALPFPGQLSLEARMGCGFGACMGCTLLTSAGPVRICREGPVFPASYINDK